MTKNIGAPNSIARYVSEASWGNNKWAVFEYVRGELIVRAAQLTRARAERYMRAGRMLVDLENVQIVPKPEAQRVREFTEEFNP